MFEKKSQGFTIDISEYLDDPVENIQNQEMFGVLQEIHNNLHKRCLGEISGEIQSGIFDSGPQNFQRKNHR